MEDLYLLPENDEGNIEYKFKLTNLDDDKFNKRLTQMLFRLNEGNGEAFYHIGRSDSGISLGLTKIEYEESLNNLKKLAEKLNCIIITIDEKIINNLYIGEFLIRNIDNYVDLKIGIAGNVDAGKTTLLGNLSKGILDDGRGKSRAFVFNHKHEIISGRTSSIGLQIIGYDNDGIIVNSKYDRTPTWQEIVNQSNKIITFFDLAGHEKYLRTTIYGLSSMYPDYCIIMIGANMGINHMTREHIGLCLTLKIPFIFVISKIDIVPDNILDETMRKINSICKNGIKKNPFIIKTKDDIVNIINNIKNDNIIPIIQISNVSGYNLDLLKKLLNYLPIRNDYAENINKSVEYSVDNTYSVLGHSTIVSGLLKSGTVNLNDQLFIGPFFDGSYRQVKVRSIHCKFKEMKQIKAGAYACISLKNITRKEIRKGMIIISDINNKIAIKEFWSHITIQHSPTTIKLGYEPFIHIEHIRQSATIKEIRKLTNKEDDNDNILRTGDKAYIKLEFILRPEYIKPEMKLIFREGKVKATGKIINMDEI